MSLLNPWVWLAALAMLAGSYGTGRFHQYRSDLKDQAEAKFTESESARLRERAAQVTAQRISDEKEARLRRVARERDVALAGLRNRPGRLPEPARASCNGGTGAQLSRDDAEFLVRFASERDEVAAQLSACQSWIRAVTGASSSPSR